MAGWHMCAEGGTRVPRVTHVCQGWHMCAKRELTGHPGVSDGVGGVGVDILTLT